VTKKQEKIMLSDGDIIATLKETASKAPEDVAPPAICELIEE
jgi:hypothetical protein